jgi:hypothetical protein
MQGGSRVRTAHARGFGEGGAASWADKVAAQKNARRSRVRTAHARGFGEGGAARL